MDLPILQAGPIQREGFFFYFFSLSNLMRFKFSHKKLCKRDFVKNVEENENLQTKD